MAATVVAAAVVAGAGAVVLAVVEAGSVVVEAGRVVETVVGSAVVAGCVVTGASVVGRWLELSGHVMPAVLMREISGYGLPLKEPSMSSRSRAHTMDPARPFSRAKASFAQIVASSS